MCSNFYGSELDLSAARELNEGGRFYDISKMPGPLGYLERLHVTMKLSNTGLSQSDVMSTACLTDSISLVFMVYIVVAVAPGYVVGVEPELRLS